MKNKDIEEHIDLIKETMPITAVAQMTTKHIKGYIEELEQKCEERLFSSSELLDLVTVVAIGETYGLIPEDKAIPLLEKIGDLLNE